MCCNDAAACCLLLGLNERFESSSNDGQTGDGQTDKSGSHRLEASDDARRKPPLSLCVEGNRGCVRPE